MSGQYFSMWTDICKKEILSTQLGISAAVEDVDDVKTFTLRTNELIDCLYKHGYNRYFLQREIQRVNNITRTEALTPAMTLPHWTKQNVFPSLSPTTPPLPHSQTLSHPYFIPPARCYNVFKAALIVALDVVVTSAIF